MTKTNKQDCPKCHQFGKAGHRRCPASLTPRDQDNTIALAQAKASQRKTERVTKDLLTQATEMYAKSKDAKVVPVLEVATKVEKLLVPSVALTTKQEVVSRFWAATRSPRTPQDIQAISLERQNVLSMIKDPRDGSSILDNYLVSWSQEPALV